MNKASIGGIATNTHVLLMQVVDAANPSRTHGSPVPVQPGDTSLLAGIGEGRAVLLTQGPLVPAGTSSGLGRVGKQEPGTQREHKEEVKQNEQPSGEAAPTAPRRKRSR